MATSKVDSKKRIVLPNGRPGDVFDIQQQAEGRFILVRLEKPQSREHTTREACLEAMRQAPLRQTITWEELRELTREP
jgi:bifunctional DNA-binding transcriptional regulator/antitoxin component of YhaV-PrlF toxin-antitoxin module